jgi:membrane protein YqaA with SNARE-associated domain
LDLVTLFASAFLAATIFPAQSEGVLLVLQAQDARSDLALLAVASVGNTLGSCVNWLVGRFAERLSHYGWFKRFEGGLERAQGWYVRWGVWSLLMSWAPIIGDPLTVVAGLMRTPFWLFLVIVAIAKTARYAGLLWLGSAFG